MTNVMATYPPRFYNVKNWITQIHVFSLFLLFLPYLDYWLISSVYWANKKLNFGNNVINAWRGVDFATADMATLESFRFRRTHFIT